MDSRRRIRPRIQTWSGARGNGGTPGIERRIGRGGLSAGEICQLTKRNSLGDSLPEATTFSRRRKVHENYLWFQPPELKPSIFIGLFGTAEAVPSRFPVGLASAMSAVSQASLHRITRNDFAIPFCAELWCALLRFVVDVVEAESFAIAVRPLEVVHQAPQEVALDRITFRRRTMQMRQVVAQIHHAVRIFHATVSQLIIRRAAVLGDVE